MRYITNISLSHLSFGEYIIENPIFPYSLCEIFPVISIAYGDDSWFSKRTIKANQYAC